MIKIPITKYLIGSKNIPKEHMSGLKTFIELRIDKSIKNNSSNLNYLSIFNALKDKNSDIFFEKILLAKPTEFMEIYADSFLKKYNFTENIKMKKKTIKSNVFLKDGIVQKSQLFKELSSIFDYSNFIIKKQKDWDAYKLCKRLELKICPYCNRTFIFTVIKNKKNKTSKITRPQLDHFFAKSRFPMFALSFYNLIPCCSICNSTIKGDDFLSLEDYHHPYLDENVDLNYKYKILSPKLLYNKEDVSIGINPKMDKKTKNTCDYFKLREVYECHSDVAASIINKYIIYNNAQIQEIINKLQNVRKLNITTEDIKRIIFEEPKDDEIIDIILGKLKKDIITQVSGDKLL